MPMGWGGMFGSYGYDSDNEYTKAGDPKQMQEAREAALQRARERRENSKAEGDADSSSRDTVKDQARTTGGSPDRASSARPEAPISPGDGLSSSGGDLRSTAVGLVEDWHSGTCRCADNPKLCGSCRLDVFKPAEWQTRSKLIWRGGLDLDCSCSQCDRSRALWAAASVWG